MNSQKKRIAVLCLLIVAAGGWLSLASQRADAPPERAESVLPKESFLADPNLSSSADFRLGNRELFLKMMFSIGLVIALGATALYVSKRVLPRVTNAPGRKIRILETTHLAPRRALHLVEVGNQRLLIASTNESITTLAHLSDMWLDVSQEETADVVKA